MHNVLISVRFSAVLKYRGTITCSLRNVFHLYGLSFVGDKCKGRQIWVAWEFYCSSPLERCICKSILLRLYSRQVNSHCIW